MAFAAAFCTMLAAADAALAAKATVRGSEMSGFGRIILQFDSPPKVSTRVSNGILVLAFSEPVTLNAERLAAELPSYVSIVRVDPDGRGMRLALVRPMRANLMEAGEQVYLDLLPEGWKGLPPGLPQHVVDELARRARAAEALVREEAKRRGERQPQPLVFRTATLPTLTRVVMETPPATPVVFRQAKDRAEILFDAPLTADVLKLKAAMPAAVTELQEEATGSSLKLTLRLAPGTELRGFREDDSFVLDFTRAPAARPSPEAPPPGGQRSSQREEGAAAERPPAAARETARTPGETVAPPPVKAASEQAAAAVATPPAAGVPSVAPPAGGAPLPPGGAAALAGEPVRPVATQIENGLTIAFPFRSRTAAAAFERGGVVTLVFDTKEFVDTFGLTTNLPAPVKQFETERRSGALVVRIGLQRQTLSRLMPEGAGWVLALGDEAAAPVETLSVSRKVDHAGRNLAVVPMAGSAGVHWLDEADGTRVAVVTAFAPAQALIKPQRFVEFRALRTAHGLAVVPQADDLTVATGLEGATVARDGGLALSQAEEPDEKAQGAGQAADLFIRRAEWNEVRAGSIRERKRALEQAASAASRVEKANARFALARFLVANGLAPEAEGVLALMAQTDPTAAASRELLFWRAFVATLTNRDGKARELFDAPVFAAEPEVALWRAVLDARAKRWAPALATFQRHMTVLDAYPDDLQGVLRLHAARAALEMKDFTLAERMLKTLEQLTPSPVPRNPVTLLRARLDEATGQSEDAIAAYELLSKTEDRPIAAEAMLRGTVLALRENAIDRNEALDRLERLSVVWRGDDIEVETLGQLGRLYAETGRWREAFQIARLANQIYTDHEVTRTLHDETARQFEELFLTGKSERLGRVEALALYYDFKEFTPIGRRGDEIVRRLADRLAELDLIEPAATLLQHQVEKRLTGAARATVAARLATLRLVGGKPAQALAVLQETRLPELPAQVKRARLLLEARALSDLSRTDLALDLIAGETGPEIDRLRADIVWQGRRWRQAGEAHEAMLGDRWQGREALSDQDRADVMRAAIAYALAEETLSLDRLRSKYAAKMADSADAKTFTFLTAPQARGTREFREIASSVVNADTLSDFLAEYRKRYPESATVARPRRQPLREAPAESQAEAPIPPTEVQAPRG
ncbi:hypothetical protein QNA08_09385 [Chelatococcus sp. SYSU_G07232]|uniref:Tetratricopeptide repeat protein n=1 Tax=Chelatococcus albus TaxID=3047466 RepID=A0ABT7AGF4_9HYPH|nr:hypothetical protein [Chelatococcus sp. SYSU_G07232]MDJ1158445.1 hypothetical protein [Chelatococcus sp. SYSU_G07232]